MTHNLIGTLYGIGVGPGDHELLTLKAKGIIERSPVIAVPNAKDEGGSLALEVIKKVIDLNGKEIINLTFPMRKDQRDLQGFWEEAKEQVSIPLKKGKDVAFITLGDPLFHSTFIYLMERFMIHNSPYPPHLGEREGWRERFIIKVIPGISSMNAASAYAGIPLVKAGERAAVLPATYEERGLIEALRDFDTVILMKVNKVMDKVLNILEGLGLKDKGVFISMAGWEKQEVVRNLETLKGKDLSYLSMLIVKKNGIGRD